MANAGKTMNVYRAGTGARARLTCEVPSTELITLKGISLVSGISIWKIISNALPDIIVKEKRKLDPKSRARLKEYLKTEMPVNDHK